MKSVFSFSVVVFFALTTRAQELPAPQATPAPAPVVTTSPVEDTLREPIVPILNQAKKVRLGAALDLLAPMAIENSTTNDDRFRIRSLDVDFAAALDNHFDAQITLAGHDETGAFEVTLHEGFILTRNLIPRTQVKLGQFLLGVGYLNQLRLFKWPFISAPRIHQQLFSSQNASDTGAEAAVTIADQWTVKLGITNGYHFGHTHGPTNSLSKPLTPTHYLHPSYRTTMGNGYAQVGLSYIGRTDVQSELSRIVGLNFESKSDLSVVPRWHNIAEIYHRVRTTSDLPLAEDLGGYVFTSHGFNDTVSGGLRIEAYTIPTLTQSNGESRKNLALGLAPIVSYASSESTIVRVGYSYLKETRDGDSDRAEQKIEFQFIARIGDIRE